MSPDVVRLVMTWLTGLLRARDGRQSVGGNCWFPDWAAESSPDSSDSTAE